MDNSVIDQIKRSLSIVDIASRFTSLRKNGDSYWGCCPFHNEKTASFKVDAKYNRYLCFGCGAKGDLVDFYMKATGSTFKSAIRDLAAEAGIDIDKKEIRKEKKDRSLDALAKTYNELLTSVVGGAALDYAKKHLEFSSATIKKYKLGYASESDATKSLPENKELYKKYGVIKRLESGEEIDLFRDRLMFPVFDAVGDVVGFSGRTMCGAKAKYINSPESELFMKRRLLYGFNFAKDAMYKKDHCILVEGQVDCIQMQTNGFPETVAPLGTALTDEQVIQITKVTNNITICFDGDNAGRTAAYRACLLLLPHLKPKANVRVVLLPKGVDPDMVIRVGGESEMWAALEYSASIEEFIWSFIAPDATNLSTMSELGSKISGLLKRVQSSAVRFSLSLFFIAKRVKLAVGEEFVAIKDMLSDVIKEEIKEQKEAE